MTENKKFILDKIIEVQNTLNEVVIALAEFSNTDPALKDIEKELTPLLSKGKSNYLDFDINA